MNNFSILFKAAFILFRTGNLKSTIFFSKLKGGSNLNLIKEFYLTRDTIVNRKTKRQISKNKLSIFNYDLVLIEEAFDKYFLEERKGNIYMSILRNIQKITVEINSFDSLGTFYEILVKNVYEIILNEDIIVIDVGMNIGIASLSFACSPNVKRVYGFEPVPVTYKMAQQNFILNGETGAKIEAYCAALGKEDKLMKIPATFGGSVGATITDFVMKKIHKESDNNSMIEVVVKDSYSAIKVIMEKHCEPILLKLDCEGAEYEIIDDLFEKKLLNKISFVIIEWHYKGKYSLTDKLRNAGFSVFTPDIIADIPVGFIYGINKTLCKI